MDKTLAPKKSLPTVKRDNTPKEQTDFVGGFHNRLNYVFDMKELPPSGQGRTNLLSRMLPTVSKSTVRRLAAGEGFPNLETLSELQREFGVSADWLINGQGTPFQGGEITNRIPANWEIVLLAKPSVDGSGRLDVSILPTTNASMAIVQAEGDAMEPNIHDGDRVLIETKILEIEDRRTYLLDTAKGSVFRRVEKSLSGGWRLIPSNDKYRPETVSSIYLPHERDRKGIRIVGMAVANIFSFLA